MVNYFELYGLPVSLHPAQDAVRKKYYELSRQFHPDRFATAGAEAMDEALKMSSIVNEAYKILHDADATMKYVLTMHGVLEEEEKYNLPPDFLMEMMELNEMVSEYEMNPSDGNKEQATGNWQMQHTQLDNELGVLTAKYDNGDHSQELLLQIKDYYFRKKYLLRIQERIAKFATP